MAKNTASLSNTGCVSLPKLTNAERQLLYDNDGCLKCRHVFVNHRSPSCPNDFPDATTYKPLMQGFVDAISRCLRRNIAAIITGDQGGAPVPTALPVAMVMGVLTDPVAYMPPNPSNVIERNSVDSDIS